MTSAYRMGSSSEPSAWDVVSAAALVAEIVSPGDETWEKLPFYAEHGVDESLTVDPSERTVRSLGLTEGGEYRDIEQSRLIDLGPQELAARIDWP
jgi:Uma2 family endonuclease